MSGKREVHEPGSPYEESVAGLVLAAGLATRMGQPKMVLPWGNSTMIGHVVQVLMSARLSKIVVVVGNAWQLVEQALTGMDVETVMNPNYANGEMLGSFQVGLSRLTGQIEAVLVVLGDQPLIRPGVVRAVLQEYYASRAAIVVPSINRRRGHPWILGRSHWSEVAALKSPETLRDFLNRHADEIHYLAIEDQSILVDIDTMEQYRHYQGRDHSEA